MRARGINYDTGFLPGGNRSRVAFDPAVVREEMRIIAQDLHCTAVRLSGADPERISIAGEAAAAVGLEVWFAPFPCELTPEQMVPLFAECARRAEVLRLAGAEVVLVLGCELSMFARGFLPGESAFDRIAAVTTRSPGAREAFGTLQQRLNDFLGEAVAVARAEFGGRITYASGPWEKVDWDRFDLVATDGYRSAENAQVYPSEIRGLLKHGKPVAITEFGCCAYEGAADRGGMGWMIVDRSVYPARLNGEYRRDEQEQVRYLDECLEVFEREGVDAAFWFTFAGYQLTHNPHDPAHDLDLAAYGVVKVLPPGRTGTTYPGMSWEPKQVFRAMAAAYGS